jgi:hypothetical protein
VRRALAIATSSRSPGGLGFLAQLTGVLEAGEIGPGGYCAWIRTDRGAEPVVWPFGYSALLCPLEILNASGEVVARGGAPVTLVGGYLLAQAGDPCMLGRLTAFHAQRALTAKLDPGSSGPGPARR